MTGITIAVALGGIATKQCRQTSNGPVWTDYPYEKWWWFREVPTPSDANGWGAFLEDRVHDTASCCVYGQPISRGTGLQRRLLHPADGDPPTLREVPRDYVILDFDSVPVPAGLDFLTEPDTAVGAALDTIDELAGCGFAAAISCSAGFKPGVRAKAVVPLLQPVLPSEMRRWAKAVNARFGMKLLDPAVLAPAQPIYLAQPILYGVHDPFPQRVWLRQGKEPIALTIPPETAGDFPAATTNGSGGGGWRRYLTQLGPIGFHEPLLSAAGAMALRYGGAPAEPLASAIHAIVQEAVLAADPGARTQEEIARYASRRFWDDAVAHAARRDGDRARRAAASVAGIRRI
jgi:hypothetical protein